MSSEYGWTDEVLLDLPLCRLTQIANAIAARKDEEFRVRALTVEWHARALGMIVASGISEESLKAAQDIRFFPAEDYATPSDVPGQPETVKVGGGAAIPPEVAQAASEAPSEPRSYFLPDPEPVRVGPPRVVSESEASGARMSDATVVEKMFGLPPIGLVMRPDVSGGEEG